MKIILKPLDNRTENLTVLTVDKIVYDTAYGKLFVCKEKYKEHKNIPYIIMEKFVKDIIK